jgi:hypothetical protein
MSDHFVFGGLAIMVTCVTVDPLALRPRLSPGLPLSNDKVMKNDLLTNKKRAWYVTRLAARNRVAGFRFGGLAIMVTCVTVDPLALRPRFSPGLPLSIRLFSCLACLS